MKLRHAPPDITKVTNMQIARTLIVTFVSVGPIAAFAQNDLPTCSTFDGSELTYACRCLPDSALGDVFGTTMYAPATSLCAGARHAGTIRAEGGIVQIIRGVAQDGFVGSERNGITSSDTGPADYSIFFMGS